MDVMTTRDERRRKMLEDGIRQSCGMLYTNMKALHDEKLYRSTHATWAEYCRDVWDMSRQYAERLIQHGHVLRLLEDDAKTATIVAVLKESHTAELSDLPAEEAAAIVVEAVSTSPVASNGKPKVTAKHVKATREKREREPGDESEAGGEAPVIRDELEREVPKRLLEKHATAVQIKSAATKLDAARRAVEEIRDAVGSEFLPVAEILVALKDVKGKIAHARYWTDCPRCKDRISPKCDRCDGHGYLPFSRRGMLSDEDKAYLGIDK